MWPPEDKEPPEGIPDEKEEQYRVSVDWFFEAEEYNEWMCEEDYEVDEKGQNKANEMYMTDDEYSNCFEKPKKKAKRKRSPSPPTASATAATTGPTAAAATPANKSKASKAAKGKSVKKSKLDETDDMDEDLTAELDDPAPENTISEVKVTPANVGRPDMQVKYYTNFFFKHPLRF